jgi:phosphotransferase system HPr-like phosphotransfer protein
MENITQLPFLKQHKLYVSSVPYELDISGGESLLTGVHGRTESEPDSEPKHVGLALKQLHTMPAARVVFLGSTQFTKSRNAVLVMVSIVGTNSRKRASFSRLLSKSASIAVFVAGTAMFASVTLVALPVAVLVVTLVLGAGVFGRAIAGWLVQTVSETEPMIHVIVKDEDEANHAVSRILSLKLEHEEKVQVEIGGHIFVDGRRVATRSKWWVAICGVLANPYDLRRANNNPLAAVEPPEGLSV